MNITVYFNILNVLITIPSLLIFPFLIKALWRVKNVCHENFWISLLTFEIILICVSISSATLAIGELLAEFSPTSTITPLILLIGIVSSATCNGSLTVCLAILAGERLIATIYYKSYEAKRYRCGMTLSLILVITMGAFDCYMWVFRGIDYFLASFVIYGLQLCASLLMFISFYSNNKLRKLTSRSEFMLTHRYQIYENLRMIRFTMPLIAHNVGGLIFSGAFTMSLRFYFFYPNMTLETSNGIYFTLCNCFIFTSFLHMHLLHNRVSKLTRLCRPLRKSTTRVTSVSSTFQPIQWRNALGQKIDKVSYQNETEMYFAQVQKVW